MDDPTIGETETAFKGLEIFDMIVYSTMLFFASYMIAKYLIFEKRHEITYLPAFYALTVALAVIRLCNFITEYRESGETWQKHIIDISSIISCQINLQIGLIQVAIMVELGIQVKLSAGKMSEEEASRKISKVRVSLIVTAGIFFVLGVCATVIDVLRTTAEIAAKGTEEDPDIERWLTIVVTTIFPCQLLFITVSLCISYIYLAWNIRKHFAKELKDEGRQIMAIFVVFALAYVSRAIVFLLN